MKKLITKIVLFLFTGAAQAQTTNDLVNRCPLMNGGFVYTNNLPCVGWATGGTVTIDPVPIPTCDPGWTLLRYPENGNAPLICAHDLRKPL